MTSFTESRSRCFYFDWKACFQAWSVFSTSTAARSCRMPNLGLCQRFGGHGFRIVFAREDLAYAGAAVLLCQCGVAAAECRYF